MFSFLKLIPFLLQIKPILEVVVSIVQAIQKLLAKKGDSLGPADFEAIANAAFPLIQDFSLFKQMTLQELEDFLLKLTKTVYSGIKLFT